MLRVSLTKASSFPSAFCWTGSNFEVVGGNFVKALSGVTRYRSRLSMERPAILSVDPHFGSAAVNGSPVMEVQPFPHFATTAIHRGCEPEQWSKYTSIKIQNWLLLALRWQVPVRWCHQFLWLRLSNSQRQGCSMDMIILDQATLQEIP